ncbi:restriction endonuclease subunit S [Streptomyces mutabilis]|uniref:restriction endonuclease subunit S n=1 Tax=Streptomyces mutabilis TaxID=67332 RepID=UPI0034DF8121
MTIDFHGIPAHWETTRLDRVATVNARIGWKNLTAAEYQPDGYPFLATPNIKNRDIDFQNVNYISQFRYDESPEIKLSEGDVLLTKDGFTLGTVNIVRSLPRPATVNGSIAVLRSFDINPTFLYYVIASSPIQAHIWSVKDGMDVLHLFQRDIKKFPIPLPPLEEQRRIADFLDIETARITRLMRLREQQLRLWAERARALASHLVTTGDRAGSRTVDWLGPVPEGWSTPSIGRISRFVRGTTFPHKYQGEKFGDFPFIKVSDFQNADIVGRMQGAENWISAPTARELGARIVPPGSILYARVGATLLLNRRCITTQPSVIDDNVRAICFDHGDPRFWGGVLSLLDMGQLVNPGPVPSISESQVSPIRVPDPDAPTQRKIADQLEKNLKQWQKARSLVERQLKLIDEQRQALITAAVTGQFDVSTASGRNVTEGVSA